MGLAQSTCSERIRRLEEGGVICGVHAAVDPAALGIGMQAFVAVRLRRPGSGEVDTARAFDQPEVVGVFHVTGATDFVLHVVVMDAAHLGE